jgi:hypothetical protein
MRASLYAETQPHRLLGAQGLLFTFGTRFTSEHDDNATTTALTTAQQQLQNGLPLPLTPAISETSQEVTMRAFTRPVALDKRTNMTASFTYGHVFSSPIDSGQEGIGELALLRAVPGGTMSLNYSYRSLPTGLTGANGKHLVSAGYNVAVSKRFEFSLNGSDYLDADSQSLLGDLIYRINSNWRILGLATLQRYASQTYNDLEFTLGRRIGARELQLTYSTYNKRISFDFTATRW